MGRIGLRLGFGDPCAGNARDAAWSRDSRAPDFIPGTDPGVVFTSGKKIAEHGGLNLEDRNVALLVASPGVMPAVMDGAVATTQIAPTILKALGFAPEELQAVGREGTKALAGLPF